MCNHTHTKEHITYLTDYDDTEHEDGKEDVYSYTIKVRTVICVHCLFVMYQSEKRVVYLVLPKVGTAIVRAYNFKRDAISYAEYIEGRYVEAEVVGGLEN